MRRLGAWALAGAVFLAAIGMLVAMCVAASLHAIGVVFCWLADRITDRVGHDQDVIASMLDRAE